MGSSQGFCQAGVEHRGPSFLGCSASPCTALWYPSELNQRDPLGLMSELKKLCGKQLVFREELIMYVHVCVCE